MTKSLSVMKKRILIILFALRGDCCAPATAAELM